MFFFFFVKDHMTGIIMLKKSALKLQEQITFSNIFKLKAVILNSKDISQYYCFCCILDQIN